MFFYLSASTCAGAVLFYHINNIEQGCDKMTDDRRPIDILHKRRLSILPQNKIIKVIKEAAKAAATLIAGFLFAATKAPLDTYPFAIALVSSLSANPVFAVAGCLLRLLFDVQSRAAIFPYCVACVFICVARYMFSFFILDKKLIVSSGRLSDGMLTRVLCALIGELSTVLFFTALNGFDVYIIAGGVFSMCCGGALTVLLTSFFDKRYTSASANEVGLLALMFLISLSLSPIRIFSVSPALVFAFGATLWAAYTGGAVRGCTAGFLIGIGCGATFAPIAALFGLCAGLFTPVSKLASASAALVAAICCGAVTGGGENVLNYLPEALAGTAAVVMAALFGLVDVSQTEEKNQSAALCRELTEKKREEENKMKMELLSNAMESISQVMRSLSEKFRRPDGHSLENMCRAVWAEYCVGCPNDCPCKDLDNISRDDTIRRLADKLMNGSKIDPEKITDLTKAKCPKRDDIIREINARAAKMTEYAIKFDKTQIFAFDYEAMSKLLSEAVLASGTGYPIDKVTSDKLRKRLQRAGISAENLVVCGDRKKYIIVTGKDLSKTSVGAEDIRAMCEDVCACMMSKPEFIIENGTSAMILEGMKALSVQYAGKQSEKQGESVCGDSVSVIESREGYFYCFICDGMGSGPQAALTARICRVFLEKMLACGNDKTTTLQMLNMFLKNKGTESFATVDLLEVDMHMKTAAFIKSGAAPSYVMRGSNLFRIASGTLPVGILADVSAELTEFELCDGDVIIMASDGIADDYELETGKDPSWFADFLCREWTDDLHIMAEKILLAAKKSGRRSDDMTVELIRVSDVKSAREISDAENKDDELTA